MAGPNGSHARRNGPPPQWPTESDEQARALEIERWHQRQAQQHGFSSPHSPPPPAPGPGYAQPGYDSAYGTQDYGQMPAHGQQDPMGHAPFGHDHRQAEYTEQPVQDPFAPQYDRFAPPLNQGHGYEPHSGPHLHSAPHAHSAPHSHPHPHSLPAPHSQPFTPHGAADYEPQLPTSGPDLRGGYDPFRQPQAYDPRYDADLGQGQAPQGYAHDGHQHDSRGDPQSWDLSHYQPGQMPRGYPPAPAAFQDPSSVPPGQPTWPPQQHGGLPEPHWPQTAHGRDAWQHPDDAPAHGLPPFAANPADHFAGRPQEHGYDGYDGHDGLHDQGADGEELEPVDEPRRGPSMFLVVGMLVGAIVVGGGLAVGYKHFSSGSANQASVAELKKPVSPEKVRPSDPGGKTIEHSDKRFLNRLASDAPADTQRQSDIDGGAKKVSTIPIVVNRDGSLMPQAPQEQPANASSGVPGLLLDGLGPPPVPPAAAQLRGDNGPPAAQSAPQRLPPPPPPVVPKVVQVAPAAPKVADLPLPKVISPPAATAAVERPAAPPKKQRAAVRDDHVAPQVASAATASEDSPSGLGSAVAPPARRPITAPSSNGYVAVLASKKSRQEALNSFADLHSQYPDVLSGMTPDVREANLGDKGMWYRLIVGPPGSREAARTVCGKLKEKGMNDCWPVAY